jgi:hypothetical protein
MANGILGALSRNQWPGQSKPGAGLLDPMTWLQISGALAQGAEQNSWGAGLGGVGNVLANRQATQQQEEDRRADQGYRGWQMKQAERQAEAERRQAELMQGYRDRTLEMEQQDYDLRRRKTEFDMANPTTRDSFRPITEAERAQYGIEANTPYALNERTGRPVSVGGTRTQEWTQGQRDDSLYVANMTDGYNRAMRMVADGFDPRTMGAGTPMWMRTSKGRDFYRAVRDYIGAELRAETGATAPESEIEEKTQLLMATVNESPENVARIFERMRTRIGTYAQSTGGAYDALYPDAELRDLPPTYQDILNPQAPADQNLPPVPEDIDPLDWAAMTPEQRALWQTSP